MTGRDGARPRLLFVSHMVPFPEYNGAASRTGNLVRQLARGFDVRVLPFFRRPLHPSREDAEEAAEALRRQGWVIESPSPVPSDWSRARRALVHPRSAISGAAFGPVRFESAQFTERVYRAVAEGTDLIHIDTLDLVDHVSRVSGVPKVANHHDIDSAALRRRSAVVKNPLVRWYVRRQAGAYERLERQHASDFALHVVCSPREREHLQRIAPESHVAVVPNGVDTSYFRPLEEPAVEDWTVVFVGGLDMTPNLDGIRFFLDEIWPLVKRRAPSARLRVIGKAPEERVRRLGDFADVVFEGIVPDIRPHLARAACIIVPLRLGGGTRLKILHAWGMGKAIVTTAVGGEGLATEDGGNLLIRNEPGAFAEGVLEVLGDARLRDRLGSAGVQTVADLYDWDVIGARARDDYRALL